MGRKKRKQLPQSRKKKRGAAGPAPLVVIAGLPEPTAKVAAQTINNDDQTRWRAVAGVFPQNDDAIYSERAITDLMIEVCAFAMKEARGAEDVRDPSRIVLAYVKARGSDSLWDGFGHSVWPIPLSYPARNLTTGRHWRFDIETANGLIRQAIAMAESEAVNSVRFRLESHRLYDSLLLPGRNFKLTKDEVLATRYREFLRGDFGVEAVDAEVKVQRFPFERLKRFYERTGGQKKSFAVDHRELVFAKAHVGQDGGQHPIESGVELTQKRLRRELEGRFRFGTPLEPAGFQHDVQWADGARLMRERFNCVDVGLVEVSGDHANIFGNE